MSSFQRRIQRQVSPSADHPEMDLEDKWTGKYYRNGPRKKFFGGRGSKLGVSNPKDKAKIARELRAAGKPVPFKAKKRKLPKTAEQRDALAAQHKARIVQTVKPKRERGEHAYAMAEKRANRRARRAPERKIVMAANLSRNHPDYGLSMPEHLAAKAERNA